VQEEAHTDANSKGDFQSIAGIPTILRSGVNTAAFLALQFLRRFLNDPTSFLYFCDYLPFEEDLALYLNKLEFPSPKYDLYQV
jgi:hypothetical protein